MKTLKYNPEIALSFTAIDRFVFRVSDIEELENISDELKARLGACHIYLICKRPRLTLNPQSIRVTNDQVYFTVEYKLLGTAHSAEVSIPKGHFFSEEVRFEVSDYPHREILTYDSSGTHIATTLVANYAHLFAGLPDEARNLEVLYVGKGLKNSAKDRLENHSTLQKILADVNSNEPDYEVFGLVYSFEKPKKPLFHLKADVQPETSRSQAEARLKKVIDYKPSVDIQVALIEASLISYFATSKYNTHYIDFPHQDVKILDDIYEADFAAITVMIDNENIGYQKIFSKAVPPNFVHFVKIDFRNIEGKFSFYQDGI
jgi:hypothetical protein